MSLEKKFTLNSGAEIPTLGFGTWQSEPGQVGAAVYEALKAGYRHIVSPFERSSEKIEARRLKPTKY